MLSLLKALVVFAITALVGGVASFLYGVIAHYFDLFILFPFVVAGAIVGTGTTVARWVRLNQGALLLLIGLLIGAAAYPVYLAGKYTMLVAEFMQGTPAQLSNFDFSSDTLATLRDSTVEEFTRAQGRADAALRAQVGNDGLVGQLLVNMEAGIPVRTQLLGEGNRTVGALVELFKLGVLVLVSASALRDTVKTAALLRLGERTRAAPRRLSAEEEEAWGKGE